jgi:tetratricopeptide (TPR) repeat protein
MSALVVAIAVGVALASAVHAQTPDSLDAARALQRQGKLDEAVAVYTCILTASPGDVEARKERGQILGWLKRYPEALADYDAVLAVTPRDAEARLGRGRVLGYMGRYADAEAEHRRALADDPRATAEALVEIGRLRFWQEDLEGAKAAWTEALILDPGNADARDGLKRLAAIPPPRRWRLDAGFRFDALTEGNSNWYWEWGRLAFRPWQGTTVIGGLDQYHRFDKNDTQLSIGAAQDLPAGFTAFLNLTFGINTSVVASQIYEAEVTQRTWIPRVIPGLLYRHMTFPGDVQVDIVSPSAEVLITPDLIMMLR